MSSLKSLLVLLALATIGYGVYTKLGQPGTELGWNTAGPADGTASGSASGSGASVEPFHGGIDLPGRSGVSSTPPAGGLIPATDAFPADRFGAIGGGGVSPATMISSSVPASQLSAGPAPTGLNTTGSLSGQMASSGHVATASSIPGSPAGHSANALASDPLRSTASDPESERITQASAQRDVDFRRFMATVYENEKNEQPGAGEAMLRSLTKVYREQPLTPAQRQELTLVLDRLASDVIWNVDHYLDSLPPIVTDGRFPIGDVARQCGVSARLLLRMNELEATVANLGDPLPAGIPLKTLRGPFEADISTEARELTVFVDGMYAGRFPLGFGRDLDLSQIQAGTWPLFNKQPASPYDQSSDIMLSPNGFLHLHGTADSASLQRADSPGQILFTREDITDLYDILTLDEAHRFTSTVTIRR